MDGRRFFLLETPCLAAEIPRMMGRVVAYKLDPLRKYAPAGLPAPNSKGSNNDKAYNPEDIIPGILPEPSVSIDRKDVLSAAIDNGLRLALGVLLGIDLGRAKHTTVELEAAEVKTYVLSNPDAVFDQLMANAYYAADVQRLFAGLRKRHAFFVTGFLTTSGATWTRRLSEERARALNAGIPVATIAAAAGGLPPVIPSELVEPTIEPSHKVRGSVQQTMRVEQEHIFAVSYSLVKVAYYLSRQKSVPAASIRIGPPRVANTTELAFGVAEDPDQDQPDKGQDEARADIFLVDMDDEGDQDSDDGEDEGSCLSGREGDGNESDGGSSDRDRTEQELNAPYLTLYV